MSDLPEIIEAVVKPHLHNVVTVRSLISLVDDIRQAVGSRQIDSPIEFYVGVRDNNMDWLDINTPELGSCWLRVFRNKDGKVDVNLPDLMGKDLLDTEL